MTPLIALFAVACSGDSASTDSADPADGSAFAGDPSGDGPQAVVTSDGTVEGPLGAIDVTIWAPDLEGPLPTVVMMPGFLATHDLYAPFAEHLASWGWRVVGFTFTANGFTDPADHETDAQEAIAVIDALEGGALGVAVDPDRIVTAGHSKGGKIAVLAAIRDARVDGVVAWDPVDSGGPPCSIDPEGCHDFSVAPNGFEGDAGEMDALGVPFLLFGAPPGTANPEEHNADRFWEGASSPAGFVRFEDGDHADWVGENDTSALTRRTQVPWLAGALLGATGTERWITGDVMASDVGAGTVTVQVK